VELFQKKEIKWSKQKKKKNQMKEKIKVKKKKKKMCSISNVANVQRYQ
jgi:hypothetical protein